MRSNDLTKLKIILMAMDTVAVVVSLALAYYYRIHIDTRPFYFHPDVTPLLLPALMLVPAWLSVNVFSGLYSQSVFLSRPREYARVVVASVVSVMAMISYEFFTGEVIFPVRVIALYFVAINFMMIIVGRELIRAVRWGLLYFDIGRQRLLLVGNNDRTFELADFFQRHGAYGYTVVATVSGERTNGLNIPHFSRLNQAIEQTHPDIIIQTDLTRSQDVYHTALAHHISYRFVPQQDRMMAQLAETEIIAGVPIIEARPTRLDGMGRVLKRVMDIMAGVLGLILLSPVMLFVAVAMKVTAPRETILYRQIRLSRFHREVGIYKFRSMKTAYNGMSPEEAFTAMGRPELIEQYRDNGDQLPDDPRITRLGRFLRATSLDELPQLLNVVKGDISLVGPRALVPQEINQSHKKDIILSVKSGLTGLAQVSGRRDISFEERRQLDVYYVQNWSLLMDVQIIFKTVVMVLFRKGAQ